MISLEMREFDNIGFRTQVRRGRAAMYAFGGVVDKPKEEGVVEIITIWARHGLLCK